MSAPDVYYPEVARMVLSRLEDEVALGQLSAMQLFTRMRTLITMDPQYCPEWQSMDTVPMDGTPILVLLEDTDRADRRGRVHAASYLPNVAIVGQYFAFDMPKAIGWMRQPAIPE